MKKVLKKAVAFITAAVAAAAMLAAPASAKSDGVSFKQIALNKYDLVYSTGSTVTLGNTDIAKKGSTFLYITGEGKVRKVKNTVGFSKISERTELDYELSKYVRVSYSTKAGTKEFSYEKEQLAVQSKDGTEYIVLNNGKLVKVTSDMTLLPECYYTEKNGTQTFYSYANGKKIFTNKNGKYGYLETGGCNNGFLLFCNPTIDGDSFDYIHTVVYNGKIVKQIADPKENDSSFYSYYFRTASDEKGDFMYGDNASTDKTTFISSTGKVTYAERNEKGYRSNISGREYLSSYSTYVGKYDISYNSEEHKIIVKDKDTEEILATRKNVYLADDYVNVISSHKIRIVTTDKTGKKFGVLMITLP